MSSRMTEDETTTFSQPPPEPTFLESLCLRSDDPMYYDEDVDYEKELIENQGGIIFNCLSNLLRVEDEEADEHMDRDDDISAIARRRREERKNERWMNMKQEQHEDETFCNSNDGQTSEGYSHTTREEFTSSYASTKNLDNTLNNATTASYSKSTRISDEEYILNLELPAHPIQQNMNVNPNDDSALRGDDNEDDDRYNPPIQQNVNVNPNNESALRPTDSKGDDNEDDDRYSPHLGQYDHISMLRSESSDDSSSEMSAPQRLEEKTATQDYQNSEEEANSTMVTKFPPRTPVRNIKVYAQLSPAASAVTNEGNFDSPAITRHNYSIASDDISTTSYERRIADVLNNEESSSTEEEEELSNYDSVSDDESQNLIVLQKEDQRSLNFSFHDDETVATNNTDKIMSNTLKNKLNLEEYIVRTENQEQPNEEANMATNEIHDSSNLPATDEKRDLEVLNKIENKESEDYNSIIEGMRLARKGVEDALANFGKPQSSKTSLIQATDKLGFESMDESLIYIPSAVATNTFPASENPIPSLLRRTSSSSSTSSKMNRKDSSASGASSPTSSQSLKDYLDNREFSPPVSPFNLEVDNDVDHLSSLAPHLNLDLPANDEISGNSNILFSKNMDNESTKSTNKDAVTQLDRNNGSFITI